MLTNKIITTVDALSIVILYTLGSNLILGKFGNKDAWLILLISIFIALPMLMIYTNIIPRKEKKINTLKHMDNVLGVYLSKGIKIIYIYYFVMLNALVLRNYTEFIAVVSLNNTPKMLVMFLVMGLCYFGVYKGLAVMGKLASYSFLALTVLLTLTVFLLTPQYNFDFIRPIFDIHRAGLVKNIIDDLTFPLLESVAFIFILDRMMHIKKSRKAFVLGVSIGGIMLSFYILISMLVLGELTYKSTYFPIYRAMSRVDLVEFIQRLEIVPATSFMLAGYFKIAVCYYVCLVLIQDVFNLKSYRNIMTPVATIIVLVCFILFDGVISMAQWARHYYMFSLPFQIFIPIFIQVVMLIKTKFNYKASK